MSEFPAEHDGTGNGTGLQRTTCAEYNLQVVDEEHDRRIASAGVAPEYIISSMGLNQEPAPQMSPPVGPISYSSHIHGEPGGGGAQRFGRAVEGYDGGISSGWVVPVPDRSSTWPGLRQVDWAPEDTEDDAVAAADSLDATHSMLGATDQKHAVI